jgi:hypothetical protein
MSGLTPILAAIMVLCLLGGIVEAWRGKMGRCLILVLVGVVLAGYFILQSFVPGARR